MSILVECRLLDEIFLCTIQEVIKILRYEDVIKCHQSIYYDKFMVERNKLGQTQFTENRKLTKEQHEQ